MLGCGTKQELVRGIGQVGGEFTRNRARRDEVTHCIVEPYKSAAMALVAFSLSFKVKTVKTAEKYY